MLLSLPNTHLPLILLPMIKVLLLSVIHFDVWVPSHVVSLTSRRWFHDVIECYSQTTYVIGEMKTLAKNGSWEITPLPAGKRTIW